MMDTVFADLSLLIDLKLLSFICFIFVVIKTSFSEYARRSSTIFGSYDDRPCFKKTFFVLQNAGS